MDREKFSSADLVIPHSEFIRLTQSKQMSIGISEGDALAVSSNGSFAPKKTTARAAMLFWSWVSVGAFIFSIYASFVYYWWSFIVGFVAMRLIHRANKEGNTTNILDAAFFDEDFYERVADSGGWIYSLSPETAENYRR
jgi:hypothetical protein